MDLTVEDVTALAPDGKVAAAGRKLAHPKSWRSLGRAPEVVWGECQGSAVYQVRVSLSDYAVKCSCPSRKQPCKHAIGLLFRVLEEPTPEDEPPEWVSDWLSRRAAAAEKRERKNVGDPESRAQRERRRKERVAAGISALELWMEDCVRMGLADAGTKPPGFWEEIAARMVDAQAPGVATRLRRMSGLPNSTSDWPERLLAELGKLALLTEAFRRIESLDAPLREDVRREIGWTLREEEVLERGESLSDSWTVIGVRTTSEGRLTVRRTWLLGAGTGRYALIVSYSTPDSVGSSDENFLPGQSFEAVLTFWPSAYPLRAPVGSRSEGSAESVSGEEGYATLEEFLEVVADAISRQPWTELHPAVLREVKVIPETDGDWWLQDSEGAALPLAGDHWGLLALSGGHPLDVVCEWDGKTLTPLGTVHTGELEETQWNPY